RQASAIGQILIEDGIISSEQLERALKVQKRLEQHRQTGEILVELGYATRKAIADAVKKYGHRLSLGDLLLEQGLITKNVLEAALDVQKREGKQLGQILIDLGYINERVLLRNLAHQSQVPYIEADYSMLDPALLRGVSPDFLERHVFLPFSRSEDGTTLLIC